MVQHSHRGYKYSLLILGYIEFIDSMLDWGGEIFAVDYNKSIKKQNYKHHHYQSHSRIKHFSDKC